MCVLQRLERRTHLGSDKLVDARLARDESVALEEVPEPQQVVRALARARLAVLVLVLGTALIAAARDPDDERDRLVLALARPPPTVAADELGASILLALLRELAGRPEGPPLALGAQRAGPGLAAPGSISVRVGPARCEVVVSPRGDARRAGPDGRDEGGVVLLWAVDARGGRRAGGEVGQAQGCP